MYNALNENAPNKIYEKYQTLNDESSISLKNMSLRFLHDTCENLRFIDDTIVGSEDIPYNMQMDVDRLCLEKSLEHFLDSGASQDAFNVYLCYIEMFLGTYDKCRHFIEMLSEFESNGGSLLMKHRDHYSHSVYVFALGLAVYESNARYREEYGKYYASAISSEKGQSVDHHFLMFWGLTALFHDMGYPFELAYEEVFGYFEEDRDAGDSETVKDEKRNRKNRPYMAYRCMSKFTNLDTDQIESLARLYSGKAFATTNDLFAYDITNKFGKKYNLFLEDKSCSLTEETVRSMLKEKPTEPDKFNYYMDHAFWSATLLFRELNETIGIKNDSNPKGMDCTYVDALTAILLHNSIYKRSMKKQDQTARHFAMSDHPLAYMLMLCDELQCWDRTSYGRNSRAQLHPMDCRFEFDKDIINATYIFDQEEHEKIEKFHEDLKLNNEAELNSYSNFVNVDGKKKMLSENDCGVVELGDNYGIDLKINVAIEKRDKSKKHTYLSESNFIHLYDFAVILNARYEERDSIIWERISDTEIQDKKNNWEEKFSQLSLEYKISNINQAKAFASYLDKIGGFYTDRPVDYDFLNFSIEDVQTIGRLEHFRWLKEHEEMGWGYAESKKDRSDRKRIHNDMVSPALMKELHKETIDEEIATLHYDHCLPEDEKDKDTKPMELLKSLLPAYEGVRFYRYKDK